LRQGKQTGKFLGTTVIETFSVHFQFSQPLKVLQNISVGSPIGGLALALSAVSNSYLDKAFTLISLQLERAFVLYRDDHLEYKNGHLSIKKQLVENPKWKAFKNAAPHKENQEGNREIRDSKHDFSYANNRKVTCLWMSAIKKKVDTIFPEICERAQAAAGVATKKPIIFTDPSSTTNARADLDSEDNDENDRPSRRHCNSQDDNINQDDDEDPGIGEDSDNIDGGDYDGGGAKYDEDSLCGVDEVDVEVGVGVGDDSELSEVEVVGRAQRRRSARLMKHQRPVKAIDTIHDTRL
jgi:hypothetical protein